MQGCRCVYALQWSTPLPCWCQAEKRTPMPVNKAAICCLFCSAAAASVKPQYLLPLPDSVQADEVSFHTLLKVYDYAGDVDGALKVSGLHILRAWQLRNLSSLSACDNH